MRFIDVLGFDSKLSVEIDGEFFHLFASYCVYADSDTSFSVSMPPVA